MASNIFNYMDMSNGVALYELGQIILIISAFVWVYITQKNIRKEIKTLKEEK